MFELRVKGDARCGSSRRCARAGLECHETDEDVMRVFVPDERRRAVAVRAGRASMACRCGICGPSVPTLEDVFARAVGEA